MALTKVSGEIIQQPFDVGIITATTVQVGSSDLNSTGLQINNINATGIITATEFSGGDISAVNGTFSGNVSIAGTLTYEDVTNIDSVGVITARDGIHVTSGSVGIGTDNPLRKLDILGTGRPVEIGSTNASNIVKLYNSATGRSTYNGVDITSNSTAGGIINAYGGYLDFGTSSSNGTNATSRLRITSGGTLESYSPDDTTPNIKWRSDDTNWYGALNQSVEGGTITSFLSCGGDWTANGTTYSATKALAAYPTSAIAIHNQYNSTWGSEFVFLTKAGGSTTTDGAVTEKLRITSSGNIGIGTAIPRDKVDLRGGSFCMTGDGSNFRPHIIVRPSSGTTTIKYFEYYFDTVKSANSPSAQDRYILDITNIATFFQGSFEVVYGTRLQSVSDSTTSTCTKTFGVNRFNNGNVAITDTNAISVDNNSNTHADLRMDVLSSTAVRMKVAFSSNLGGSSFCSGVVRGWGVFDVFREPGSGGANQLTFYNGM